MDDFNACLRALHGLKGIGVDWGAVALVDQVSHLKEALLAGNYQSLAQSLLDLVDLQRETRSALLVRLAKCAATKMCQPTNPDKKR